MSLYVITIALIFAIMLLGIAVDRLYRNFAARHPQLGPFRKSEWLRLLFRRQRLQQRQILRRLTFARYAPGLLRSTTGNRQICRCFPLAP